MAIPSHNYNAVMHLWELNLQCQLVLRTVSRLKAATSDTAPIDVVADCASCLSAIAAIRRHVYPPKDSSARVKTRASAILNLLGRPPLQNIQNVAVRNSWEHSDQRLDDVLDAKQNDPLIAIAPVHVSEHDADASKVVLRRFNPKTFSIEFLSESIALEPCVTEVNDLRLRLDAAFKKLVVGHVDV